MSLRRLVLVLAAASLSAACSDDVDPDAVCAEVGVLCTVAGDGDPGLGAVGVDAREGSLYLPMDVGLDLSGGVYVVDWNNHRVLQIDDAGRAQPFIGSGALGDGLPKGIDTDARAAAIYHPTDVVFTSGGGAPGAARVYVALWHNDAVGAVDAAGKLSVAVGSGEVGFAPDGAKAATAAVYLPSKLALAPDGRLCFSEAGNQRVRCVQPDGSFATIMGPKDGAPCVGASCVGAVLTPAFDGDGGPASSARIALPAGNSAVPAGGIAFGPDGALYLADTDNHRVRRLGPDGLVTTVAGSGPTVADAPAAATATVPLGDGGPATAARLASPSDVAIDADGSVYLADRDHDCVRVVDPGGVIRTVVGVCGQRGSSGDRGPATSARLNRPYGVAIRSDGRLYIADTHNHRVRAVRLR